MVGESVREKLSLPVNDVVEYVPAGRRFVHHFGVPSALGVLATLADGTNGLYRAMRETNQRPAADGLCFMEVRMTARRRDVRKSYGVFQVVLR